MPLTGFLVNRGSDWICAVDADAAAQAMGAVFPLVAGSPPLVCHLESSVFSVPNNFANTVQCSNLTASQTFTNTHAIKLMMCDPAVDTTAFMDGMQIGWGVVGAMIAALAVIFLKKAYFQ